MHDDAGAVLYAGKAVNLRQRLSSYRRTRGQSRRIVRLIHSADRIEWEPCASEDAALRREAELIRTLQPRFNRAGRWSPPPLHVRLAWPEGGFRVECAGAPLPGDFGPFRSGVRRVAAALARLLWLAAHPDVSVSALPHALSGGRAGEAEVPLPQGDAWTRWLTAYFECGELAAAWELAERLGYRNGTFESAFVRAQWEPVAEFARRHPARVPGAG
jgi:hypothetical protein